MEISEEQRRRSEANRLAALEKRKRFAEAAAATASPSYTTAFPASGTPTFPSYDTTASAEWRLAKCPRIAPPAPQPRFAPLPHRPSPPPPPPTPPQPPVGFKVVLEVCSPDEFLVAVGPAEGKAYAGEADCFGAVQDCLAAASVIQYSATQSLSQSGRLCPVFKLMDYDVVLKCLKKLPGAVVEDIPSNTRRVIQSMPMFPGQKWASDKEVDELLKKLPQQLKDALLPFQLEGVKFGLRRRGRCLIADEMGLGKTLQDYSKGTRLTELNVLLSQTVMIRRLKEHLLNELPPKRRQIIRLKLKAPDIRTAISSSVKEMDSISCNGTLAVDLPIKSNDDENTKEGNFMVLCANRSFQLFLLLWSDDSCKKSPRHLTLQEIGIAKLSGFGKWFSNHFIMNGLGDNHNLDPQSSCQKTIIFAHHLKVLDGIQVFVSENGIKFVRIDGSTLQRERKEAVDSFRLDPEVKVAIIGITAGGVGLDFSSAQNVVFVELPKSASELLQAEDRAHRRGQTNAVNIYIFCAKNTSDESHWLQLNQSLFRVSSLMNGKKDAIREIEVDQVCHLEEIRNTEEKMQCKLHPLENQNAENDDMSIECFPGIEDLELDLDFTIRTIPLEFEDESLGTSLKNNPTPTVLEDRSCIDVSLSPAAAFCTAMSSCKSMKARRRLSGNSGTLSQTAPISDFPIQVESLRFEVSRHTGRIHLYSCVPGHDSRPKPLSENFLPEELNSPLCSSSDVKARTLLLKKIPAFCNVFKAFIKEWLALRPIDQSRLLGKPLQLPLSLELCFLKDSINHSTEEYRLRTSGRALRQALFQIERGKCSQCKLDCCKLVKHIKPLPMEKREEYIRKAAPNIASRKKLLDKLVREPTDGNAWHADHIIPVYKGGGECKLENMRTLCVACHYEVTKAQHKELKEIRKKAKEHLKNALHQQKDKASEAAEEIDDSSLLVTVPGSAYSIQDEVPGNAHEIVAE
ncbi:hypothetical protein BAE44_0003138 [Dichanthelium oligosanthes]|uniref:Helicase C-terminal domain-containing protein n=1 Tax=Dichanthelium oligosanthes TaxID=888268 RepID=A0A1E5WEM0_9POAL|nr:hypothetical protein BAE44_0003138 [Dichanthelium oligosanthes]